MATLECAGGCGGTDLGLVIQWTAALPLTAGIDRVAADGPTRSRSSTTSASRRTLGTSPTSGAFATLPGSEPARQAVGDVRAQPDGYPFRDTWAWAEGVLDAFGPERTIWASDWPLAGEHATYRQLRDLVDELPFIDGATGTALLSTTPGRLGISPMPESVRPDGERRRLVVNYATPDLDAFARVAETAAARLADRWDVRFVISHLAAKDRRLRTDPGDPYLEYAANFPDLFHFAVPAAVQPEIEPAATEPHVAARAAETGHPSERGARRGVPGARAGVSAGAIVRAASALARRHA